MKYTLLLWTLFLLGITASIAQQNNDPLHNQNTSVQDITRIVPELLPQAIRDSINSHPIDKNAEVTSAEEMSKNGKLIYKINFLKDQSTWSKTYDVDGRHLDEAKKEENYLLQ